MIIKVLDVGHGLCVHVSGEYADFVFDCGTHGTSGVDRVPQAWTALSRALGRRDRPVEAIAVSHLHWDHYCGFLDPMPGISSAVRVIMPRLPVLSNAGFLRERFAAALLSSAPLDPSLGPLDIDLMRRIRRYAPAAQPVPVSAGANFVAGGDQWRVLWPPSHIQAGTRGLTKIERAVAAYEDAAKNSPETRRRLEAVRESETFRELLSEFPGDTDRTPVESATQEGRDDLDSLEDGAHSEELEDLGGVAHDNKTVGDANDLERAGKAVRAAANDLSLILLSTDSKVLLTGDATRYAVSSALPHAGNKFNLVVTPHHGGRRHVPASLQAAESAFYASSAGGTIARHVSSKYDQLGLHHRTNEHGGAAYIFGGPFSQVAPFEWVEDW